LCVEKELAISGSAHAVRLSCDSNRVQQVLGNLVANAIKFTPKGGGITINASLSGSEILFRVADTGPGITEEARAHVFERYWRGKARDLSTGVGLGLFIAKGIVDAHGGRIWVEGAIGGGSVFCFTVPLG
ncbi:MAG: ATP-binding protein, partial [Deltaproteobacteria bacterium]